MAPPPAAQQAPQLEQLYKTERENLDLIVHKWELQGVEERLVAKFRLEQLATSDANKKYL